MEGDLKVGIVGFGYWGPKLVRNFSEMSGAILEWVVDLDEAKLAKVRRDYPGVKVTTSVGEMLASDVDAVVIATPIRTHYKLARQSLLAGKHVMVEKPLTDRSEHAEELVSIADRLGLVLMVGHTFVYNGAIQALREIIASGELGDIYYVDSARLNLGLFQPDINVLWDLAPHDVSILRYILGMEPLSVSAHGSAHVRPGVHDVVYAEFAFPHNILAHVHLSWLDPCKVRRVTVVGSRKMVVCNDVADVEKIRIYDKGVERTYVTDKFSDFHLEYRYGGVHIPYVPFREPLAVQCEHFVSSIRHGTTPTTDGREGLQVVRILEQADRSLQEGGVRKPLMGLLDGSRLVGAGKDGMAVSGVAHGH